MKKLKKSLSLLAVIAFLITALVPVSGLAATNTGTFYDGTGVTVPLPGSTVADPWTDTAPSTTKAIDIYQWATAPVTIQLATATGRATGDYDIATNLGATDVLATASFTDWDKTPITNAASTATDIKYTVLRYEKEAANSTATPPTQAVYWYAVVAVHPAKGTLTADGPSASTVTYGATSAPTIQAKWTAAPAAAADNGVTLTVPATGNTQPPADGNKTLTYAWTCKDSASTPNDVDLKTTNAANADTLTLTTPTNIKPDTYGYICTATNYLGDAVASAATTAKSVEIQAGAAPTIAVTAPEDAASVAVGSSITLTASPATTNGVAQSGTMAYAWTMKVGDGTATNVTSGQGGVTLSTNGTTLTYEGQAGAKNKSIEFKCQLKSGTGGDAYVVTAESTAKSIAVTPTPAITAPTEPAPTVPVKTADSIQTFVFTTEGIGTATNAYEAAVTGAGMTAEVTSAAPNDADASKTDVTVTVTVTPEAAGGNDFKVTLSSKADANVKADATFNVAKLDDATVTTPIEAKATGGGNTTQEVTLTGTNLKTATEYTATKVGGSPAGAPELAVSNGSATGGTLTITVPAACAPGDYTYTLTGNDPAVVATVKFTVSEAGKPAFTTPAAINVTAPVAGAPDKKLDTVKLGGVNLTPGATYTATVAGGDNGATDIVAAIGTPTTATEVPVDITVPAGAAGAYTVTVANAASNVSVDITVNVTAAASLSNVASPVNITVPAAGTVSVPTIGFTGSGLSTAADAYTIEVQPEADTGAPEFAVTANDATSVTVTPTVGVNTTPGNYTITLISKDDPYLKATAQVNIVKSAITVSTPPIITSTNPITIPATVVGVGNGVAVNLTLSNPVVTPSAAITGASWTITANADSNGKVAFADTTALVTAIRTAIPAGGTVTCSVAATYDASTAFSAVTPQTLTFTVPAAGELIPVETDPDNSNANQVVTNVSDIAETGTSGYVVDSVAGEYETTVDAEKPVLQFVDSSGTAVSGTWAADNTAPDYVLKMPTEVQAQNPSYPTLDDLTSPGPNPGTRYIDVKPGVAPGIYKLTFTQSGARPGPTTVYFQVDAIWPYETTLPAAGGQATLTAWLGTGEQIAAGNWNITPGGLAATATNVNPITVGSPSSNPPGNYTVTYVPSSGPAVGKQLTALVTVPSTTPLIFMVNTINGNSITPSRIVSGVVGDVFGMRITPSTTKGAVTGIHWSGMFSSGGSNTSVSGLPADGTSAYTASITGTAVGTYTIAANVTYASGAPENNTIIITVGTPTVGVAGTSVSPTGGDYTSGGITTFATYDQTLPLSPVYVVSGQQYNMPLLRVTYNTNASSATTAWVSIPGTTTLANVSQATLAALFSGPSATAIGSGDITDTPPTATTPGSTTCAVTQGITTNRYYIAQIQLPGIASPIYRIFNVQVVTNQNTQCVLNSVNCPQHSDINQQAVTQTQGSIPGTTGTSNTWRIGNVANSAFVPFTWVPEIERGEVDHYRWTLVSTPTSSATMRLLAVAPFNNGHNGYGIYWTTWGDGAGNTYTDVNMLSQVNGVARANLLSETPTRFEQAMVLSAGATWESSALGSIANVNHLGAIATVADSFTTAGEYVITCAPVYGTGAAQTVGQAVTCRVQVGSPDIATNAQYTYIIQPETTISTANGVDTATAGLFNDSVSPSTNPDLPVTRLTNTDANGTLTIGPNGSDQYVTNDPQTATLKVNDRVQIYMNPRQILVPNATGNMVPVTTYAASIGQPWYNVVTVGWRYKTGSGAGTDANALTIPENVGYSGVNSPCLTIGPLTADMDGAEFALVVHLKGSEHVYTTSPWVKLDIADMEPGTMPNAEITSYPQATNNGVSVTATADVTFTASAQSSIDESDLTYQWQKRQPVSASNASPAWEDMPEETQKTLTLTSVSTDLNGTEYRCRVTNHGFSIATTGTSNAIRLNVAAANGSVIFAAPTEAKLVNLYAGRTLTTDVTARSDNEEAVSYQWYVKEYKNPVPTGTNTITNVQMARQTIGAAVSHAVEGATSPALTTSPLTEGVYEYTCRVSNTAKPSIATNSEPLYVVVTRRSRVPVVSPAAGTATNPNYSNVGVVNGQALTMSVDAWVASQEPLTYQWSVSRDTTNWEPVAGTEATLTIPTVTSNYGGYYYRCTVTNAAAGETTNSAMFYVNVWDVADTPTLMSSPDDQTPTYAAVQAINAANNSQYTVPNPTVSTSATQTVSQAVQLTSTVSLAQDQAHNTLTPVWFTEGTTPSAAPTVLVAFGQPNWNDRVVTNQLEYGISDPIGTATTGVKAVCSFEPLGNGRYSSTLTFYNIDNLRRAQIVNGNYKCVWMNIKTNATGEDWNWISGSASSGATVKVAPQVSSAVGKIAIQVPGAPEIVLQTTNPVSAAVGTTATFDVTSILHDVANTWTEPGSLVYTWQVTKDGGYTWSNCLSTDGTGQFTSSFTTIPLTQEMYDNSTASNVPGTGSGIPNATGNADTVYQYRCIVANRTTGLRVRSNTFQLIVTPGSEVPPVTPTITVNDGVDLTITDNEELGKILMGAALTVNKDGHPASELLGMIGFVPDSEGYELRVVNAEGTALSADDIIGTGCKIELIDTADGDKVLDTVTIIVRGDVNGSGVISLTQLVRMAAGFKDATQLNALYTLAGDMDGSGAINLTDLVQEAAIYRTEILDASATPTPVPTAEPTAGPTTEPTAEPTTAPTTEPTAEPTTAPTTEPTTEPTAEPTASPSAAPTVEPTETPSAA